jgi:hypothetical protein
MIYVLTVGTATAIIVRLISLITPTATVARDLCIFEVFGCIGMEALLSSNEFNSERKEFD